MLERLANWVWITGVFLAASCGANQATLVTPESPIAASHKEKETTVEKADSVEAPRPENYLLRSVYLSDDSSSERVGVVGRLAIIRKGQPVPITTKFSKGDRIKFEISSNEQGWVYIFHRPPEGVMMLLWPTKDNTRFDNFITRHQPKVIPKRSSIVFDNETGAETFFVAIVPESQNRTLYSKTDEMANQSNSRAKIIGGKKNYKAELEPISKNAQGRIELPITESSAESEKKANIKYQIAVRSAKGTSTRGVYLGADRDDVNSYFALKRENGEAAAAIAFKLAHE